MKYRQLGKTGLFISEIGLGCWAMGGPSVSEQGVPSGWAAPDPGEIIEGIRRGVQSGVNHFDNADVYGNGQAERLLASALGPHRSQVIISSKVGYLRGSAPQAYDPLHIRHQCEQSLKNLDRDWIDIYYLHHADFGPDDCFCDEAVETMQRLKSEGKIRCIGFSAYSVKDFVRLIPRIQPEVVQSWAHCMDYHFIAPGSPLMNICQENGISFIAFSPINQGILSGKYLPANPPDFGAGDHRSRSEKFKPEYLVRAQRGLHLLREHFGEFSTDLIRVALQFVLYHDNVGGVIPGFRSAKQVKELCAGADSMLSGSDIAFVRKAFSQQL